MEVTPGRRSLAKDTTPPPRGVPTPIYGSAPQAFSQAARQTSGIGGFHLIKSDGRATAELNVDALWFDTTKPDSFNSERASKVDRDFYYAMKATVNPTLGSPVARRGASKHVRNLSKGGIQLAENQLVPSELSDNKSHTERGTSSDTASPSTPRFGRYSLSGIGVPLGSTNVFPDRRLSYPPSSVDSNSPAKLAAEQLTHSFRPHANSLQTVRSQIHGNSDQSQSNPRSLIDIPSSTQRSPLSMETNNSNKMHYASNLEGSLNHEPSIPKTVDGPSQRPNSALKIDANRGPYEFHPRTTDHFSQSNSYAAAFAKDVMPNSNQPFGSRMVYNSSGHPFDTMVQTSQISDPTGVYNHSVNPNQTVPSFNPGYPSTEIYNPHMAAGGTFLQDPMAYHAPTQYPVPNYQDGLMTSNDQYGRFSAGYTAPEIHGDSMMEFKQSYHQHASFDSPSKQNAQLLEVNRAFGAFRPFSPAVTQNAITGHADRFYRPTSADNAQSGQGHISMGGIHASATSGRSIVPGNIAYGSFGGNAGSESQGGGMAPFTGFSGPPGLYAPPESQSIGTQNLAQYTSSARIYTAPGEQTAGLPTHLNQHKLSSGALVGPESLPNPMSSTTQGFGSPSVYSFFEPKSGSTSRINHFSRSNAPSPSVTFAGDGSRASSFRSDSATVGNLDAVRASPKVLTNSTEMFMAQTQSPVQPSALKNYFGPNPFGPVKPPLGPIRLPPEQTQKPSWHLHYIAPNGTRPQVDMALDSFNLPFAEMCRNSMPKNKGVLRIINIPWNVNRAEILAFLGRNAQVKESEEPVHIILDRFSGKTMEVFVEFEEMDEVMTAVNRYYQNKERGRSGRLGDRHVSLEVSCQEALMKALFPKAKNVTWNGPRPVIEAKDPNDVYNSGFQGFLTKEELLLLAKVVEQPQRTPYGVRCPQRPFESIISIIKKYPWYMVDHVTLEDRDFLFSTASHLTAELYKKIQEDSQHTELTWRLLRRLQLAIFKCHGFTEAQKDDICFICDLNPTQEGLAPYADHWYVLKAIGPKPRALHDVILFYIALLREATTLPGKVTLAERASNEVEFPIVFGNMGIEYPADVQQMTFAQVARIEWNVIEKLLRKTLED